MEDLKNDYTDKIIKGTKFLIDDKYMSGGERAFRIGDDFIETSAEQPFFAFS
jgi:hypothetical protein